MPVNLIDRTGADALIPIEYANEIIQLLPEGSLFTGLVRRITMGAKQSKLPVISTLPKAYWVDQTVPDLGLKATTNMGWEQKTLTAEELAVIVPVPEAVLDDSNFDIWGEVRPRIVEAIGQALDLAMAFGIDAPTSWPTGGIVGAATTASNVVTVDNSVTTKDSFAWLNDTLTMVELDGYTPSSWAGNPSLRGRLRGTRSTDGVPIYAPALTADSPDMIWGLPVRYTRNGGWVPNSPLADAVDAIVGDWRFAILGIRQDITMKLLTEAVITDALGVVLLNLAQQDAVALRVVFRAGFAIASPVNRMNETAATRSPFAVMKPDATP
jgi:HK97 family phage major capsid protein